LNSRDIAPFKPKLDFGVGEDYCDELVAVVGTLNCEHEAAVAEVLDEEWERFTRASPVHMRPFLPTMPCEQFVNMMYWSAVKRVGAEVAANAKLAYSGKSVFAHGAVATDRSEEFEEALKPAALAPFTPQLSFGVGEGFCDDLIAVVGSLNLEHEAAVQQVLMEEWDKAKHACPLHLRQCLPTMPSGEFVDATYWNAVKRVGAEVAKAAQQHSLSTSDVSKSLFVIPDIEVEFNADDIAQTARKTALSKLSAVDVPLIREFG
jgi:hypothetical protein